MAHIIQKKYHKIHQLVSLGTTQKLASRHIPTYLVPKVLREISFRDIHPPGYLTVIRVRFCVVDPPLAELIPWTCSIPD